LKIENPDHDINRQIQELLAQRAKLNGFRHAQRYIEVGACEYCVDHALEIIDIGLVISGKADHHNGKCFWRFLP
jgi:hypothetical protein